MNFIYLNSDNKDFNKYCKLLRETIIEENLAENGGTLKSPKVIWNCTELLLAIELDTIIGFIATKIKDNKIFISQIAVKKSHQQQGIGKKLVNNLMEKYRNQDITCNVRKFNTSSQKMFESLRFIKERETKTSYWYRLPNKNQ